MKSKKILGVVLTLIMALALTSTVVAYAAGWISFSSNKDNTVQIGDAITISLDKADGAKYFDGVELDGPGSETVATAITVTSSEAHAYNLAISGFTLEGVDSYTANDLYIKIADTSEGLANADAVKFEDGVKLIENSSELTKTVYIAIGLGDNATAALAGKTITFGIAVQDGTQEG